MPLQKRGKHWFGNSHADIREELLRFSNLNGYRTDNFADIFCQCGNDTFYFFADENEGVAIRRCRIRTCRDESMMGDSVEDAESVQFGCLCGKKTFQITVGINRYRNLDNSMANDVRWIYFGCRCTTCGLIGCYADWKNEFEDYEKLLKMM